MDWTLLMSALFPAGFMVGLVVAMRVWPPNSVNRMYGYRTRRSMASQEAWDYAQPRSIELMRQWTVWMVVWTPLVLWRWRLEDATLILCGLMTVGVLLPVWFVERELKTNPYQPSGHLNGYGWAFTLFVFCSVMAPIQHHRSEPEKQVIGKVVALRWHTSSRDVGFSLAGDDTHYYINRGLDMGMDSTSWTAHVLGQTVVLEVVNRPAGLNWFGSVRPIRGVLMVGDTLYRTGRVKNP